MVTYFKKGQTIFDPETGEYQKIETVKRLKMWGVERTFYKLESGVAARPEAVWREHHEVLSRQPTSSDYDDILN